MKSIRTSYRILTVFFLTLMLFLIVQTFSFAAKDKKKGFVMTEVELQSELMSYADRFASIITQSLEDFETLTPTPQARQVILSDLVYSISSVYTIAAQPNPQVGLLDMVAVTAEGVVERIDIKPARTDLTESWGVALWTPTFSRFMHDWLATNNYPDSSQARHREREISVGHVINAALEASLTVRAVIVSDKPYLDIGTPGNLMRAIRKRTPRPEDD